MARIRKREAARRDLVGHFVYLAEGAGIETADRFLIKAETTFANLLEYPYSGPLIPTARPELHNVRRWRVADFENWLIFYQSTADGISIIRVLHAAQDWWSLLDITE